MRNEYLITQPSLCRGYKKSCRNCRKEETSRAHKSHGMYYTDIYRAWGGIKTRCYNQNSEVFKHYGARGITMCDRWRDSFENFYNDMGPKPEDGQKYSIERKDVNGNYCPENCIWGTTEQQANNRTDNRYITYDNKTLTVTQWSKLLNIHVQTIKSRLAHGWSVENAFTTKPQKRTLKS